MTVAGDPATHPERPAADPPVGPPGVAHFPDSGLLDAVMAIASHLELAEVLDLIVRHACRLTGATYGALGVLSSPSPGAPSELEQFHFVGLSVEEARLLGDFPRGHGVLGVLIENPRPLRLTEISAHPASVGLPSTHPTMHTFLGVPIRVGDAVFGNLYLCEKAGGKPFSDADEQIIVGLAAAAGVAIDNARLFADARARQSWLGAAARASAELSQDLATAPALLAELAHEAGGCTGVAVCLPQARDDEVGVSALAEARPARINGAAGREAGQLLHRYVDVSSADGSASAALFGGPAEERAQVRLELGGGAPGLLLLHREGRRWTVAELESVRGFASQVGLTLDRLRNEQDRRRLAVFWDRDRIARDLHDRVIQRIFAVGLGLHSLRRRVSDSEGRGRLQTYIEDLNATITEIRASIFFLHHDPAAGPHSLRSDVLTITAESSRILGFEPQVTFRGPVDATLPPSLRTDLLATLREALSNVIRHAGAAAVHVLVHWDVDGQQLELRVDDDGAGPDPTAAQGLGLRNTAARARAAGGSARLVPQPAGGTSFRWIVPLPPPPAAEERPGA